MRKLLTLFGRDTLAVRWEGEPGAASAPPAYVPSSRPHKLAVIKNAKVSWPVTLPCRPPLPEAMLSAQQMCAYEFGKTSRQS
ncbi:hypothetical protein MHYP_G00298550 [Metynnis hypsauchen]